METIQATGKESSRKMGEDKMSKVMIEGMEMPNGCANCLLSCWDIDGRFVCTAMIKNMRHREVRARNYAKRPLWCPLQEVKE